MTNHPSASRALLSLCLAVCTSLVAQHGARASLQNGTFYGGSTPPLPQMTERTQGANPAHIQLVFWGGYWQSSRSSPSIGDIQTQIGTLIAGGYLHAMAQWGIPPSVLESPASYPWSEPNPSNVDAPGMLRNAFQINAGDIILPSNDPNIEYIVVTPPGVTCCGANGTFSWTDPSTNISYPTIPNAWVGSNGGVYGGSAWDIAEIIGHELAEMVSDGGGAGVNEDALSQYCGGQCQVADICSAATTGVAPGTYAPSYWSQSLEACTVPTVSGDWLAMGWPGGNSSTTNYVGGPMATLISGGLMTVFTSGAQDKQLWYQRQFTNTVATEAWQNWQTDALPGGRQMFGPLAVVGSDVAVTATDGTLWWTPTTGGLPGTWSSLGKPSTTNKFTGPMVAGSSFIFARGSDNNVYYAYYTISGGRQSWSTWSSLGGPMCIDTACKQPTILMAAGLTSAGQAMVLIQGQSGAVYYNVQNTNLTKTFPYGWKVLANTASIIQNLLTVAKNQNGQLEAFAEGLDQNVYTFLLPDTTHAGSSGWTGLGGPVSQVLSAAPDVSGALQLFAGDTSGDVITMRQTGPNSTTWTPFANLAGSVSAYSVAAVDSNGFTRFFARSGAIVGGGSGASHDYGLFQIVGQAGGWISSLSAGLFWGQNWGYQWNPLTSDWSYGNLKGECESGEALIGISAEPFAQAHAILCGSAAAISIDFEQGSSCYPRYFGATIGNNDGDSSDGNWDPGNYLAACQANEFVAGVSQTVPGDPYGQGRLNGLLCCPSAKTLARNSCTVQVFYDQNSSGFAYPDWDYGYDKGECPAGSYVAGVSAVTSNGVAHALLCCKP